MADASTLLSQTETAISSCLTAQAYTAYGRTKQMAALKELREFRKELKGEIDASGNNGSMVSLLQLEEPAA